LLRRNKHQTKNNKHQTKKPIKKLIKKIVSRFGYELRPIAKPVLPGSSSRPVGDMRTLLQDMKARGLHCTQIVDIGANAGHWSRMAKGVFPDAAFCLIEPQEEMRPQLEALCANHPRMQFHLAAAGPTEGKMTLTVWDDLLGSSLLPVADAQALAEGTQREVPILTIDTMLAGGSLQMPQLIKLDIQGFELEALKGAETTFGHTEAYILEVSLFAFEDGPQMPQLIDVVLQQFLNFS
jgi:FkbM family methyltransferase